MTSSQVNLYFCLHENGTAGSSFIKKFKTKMDFEDLKVEVPLDEENASDLLDVPVSLCIV